MLSIYIVFQVCKQLTALAPKINSRSFDYHLNFFREAMGIMQHHDAVTGTEKQLVADDYARRLTIAIRACGINVRNVLNQLTTAGNAVDTSDDVCDEDDAKSEEDHPPAQYEFEFSSCLGLNISKCETTETNENFIVTLYNPLPHSTFQYVRLPVTSEFWSIRDYKGMDINFQVVPIPEPVKALKYRLSSASYELVFLASELPPIGYKSYYVSREGASDPEVMLADQADINEQIDDTHYADGHFKIGNQYINLTFNEKGQLEGVESNGASSKLAQTFFYYEGADGNNEVFKNRSSGAYIFRPNSTEQIISDKVMVRVVRGPIVEEVHQVISQVNGYLN